MATVAVYSSIAFDVVADGESSQSKPSGTNYHRNVYITGRASPRVAPALREISLYFRPFSEFPTAHATRAPVDIELSWN